MKFKCILLLFALIKAEAEPQQMKRKDKEDMTDVNNDLNSKTRLLHDLFENYEKDLLPDKQLPIQVGLDVSVLSIIELSEKSQSLNINIWLSALWFDMRFSWDPEHYGGTTLLHMSTKKLWLPDITPVASDHDNSENLESNKVRVFSDGAVLMQLGTSVSFLCQLDMANFPFDVQMCPMKISSYVYNGSYLELYNLSGGAHLGEFRNNGEWKIHSVPACQDSTDYTGVSQHSDEFSGLVYVIILQRRGLYYVFNIILPCIFITIVSHTVFLLPPESGERISMGLTVLLSLCVFLTVVAEKLPATSRTVPLIGQYFASTIILLSLTCVLTVLILNLHHHAPTPLPRALRRVVLQGLGTVLGMNPPRGPKDKDTKDEPTADSEGKNKCPEKPPVYLSCVNVNNNPTKKNECPEKPPLYLRCVKVNKVNNNPAEEKNESPEKPPMYLSCIKINNNPPPDDTRSTDEDLPISDSNDWKRVARILDRFFFILFLTANLLCTVCILTHRKPLKSVPCVQADVYADLM